MWNLKKVLKFNKRVNEDYICWYFLQNDFYPCRKNFSTFRNDFKAKVMCEFINLFRFLNYGVLLNYFVFVPAYKAPSNVNVVWNKCYGHIFKEEIVSSSTFKKSWLSIQPAKTATSHYWHIPIIYWYLNYMHSHSNFA